MGDDPPADPGQLFEAVYEQLRAIAAEHFRHLPPGATLTPTVLVHEAYIRLSSAPGGWCSREHFVNTAALAMRQIAIEYARRRGRLKRGGGRDRVPLAEDALVALPADDDVLALDEALTLLADRAPTAARVVVLSYYGGASWAEVAVALGTTEPAARHEWAFARAWLYQRLSSDS